MVSAVIPLAAGTQSYDWGKVGLESKAAQYATMGIPGFKLDESKPYAEVSYFIMAICKSAH